MKFVILLIVLISVFYSSYANPIPTEPNDEAILRQYLKIANILKNETVSTKDGGTLIPCWDYHPGTGEEAALTEATYKYCGYYMSSNKVDYFVEGWLPDEDMDEETQRIDRAFGNKGLVYIHFSDIHDIYYGRRDMQTMKFYCNTPACNIPSKVMIYEKFQNKVFMNQYE